MDKQGGTFCWSLRDLNTLKFGASYLMVYTSSVQKTSSQNLVMLVAEQGVRISPDVNGLLEQRE